MTLERSAEPQDASNHQSITEVISTLHHILLIRVILRSCQ